MRTLGHLGGQLCACIKFSGGHRGSCHLLPNRNNPHATAFALDPVILQCVSTSPTNITFGITRCLGYIRPIGTQRSETGFV
jgi:hypothetical protein